MSEKIFVYEVDWFNFFENYLKNFEKLPEKTHYNIKSNIIEANQSLDNLIKSWNLAFANKGYQLIPHPSKETHFKNLELKSAKGSYYFYIREENAENPRFWIIYNLEPQKQIINYVKSIFQRFYRQDCVYLSNKMMINYASQEDISTGGFSLVFKQSFYDDFFEKSESENEDDTSPETEEELELDKEDESEIENEAETPPPKTSLPKNTWVKMPRKNPSIGLQNPDDLKNVVYSMRLWAGSPNTYKNIVSRIHDSGLPINYKSLMCFFTDEDQNQILKEEFNFWGGFTISSGSDFERHIKFVQSILQDYKEKITFIENYRMNLKEGKGKLIRIDLNEGVNRENFIERINQYQNIFRLYFTRLYTEENYNYYRVADLHNGDHFYAQVYDNCLYLNLHKECCGNNVFRLFTNLQKHFSPSINLEIDGNRMIV